MECSKEEAMTLDFNLFRTLLTLHIVGRHLAQTISFAGHGGLDTILFLHTNIFVLWKQRVFLVFQCTACCLEAGSGFKSTNRACSPERRKKQPYMSGHAKTEEP